VSAPAREIVAGGFRANTDVLQLSGQVPAENTGVAERAKKRKVRTIHFIKTSMGKIKMDGLFWI